MNELPKEYAELVEVHKQNKPKEKASPFLVLNDKGAVRQLLSNLENIILFEPMGKSLAFNEFMAGEMDAAAGFFPGAAQRT